MNKPFGIEIPSPYERKAIFKIKKEYPYELKKCVPKIDTEWSWRRLREVLVKLHRKNGKVEREIL